MKRSFSLSLACACALASSAFGAPRFANIFTSGAVLQRDLPVPVWGWTDPNATVTVTLSKDGIELAKQTATAYETGRWMLRLPAQKAGGTYTLKLSGGDDSVTLDDILFGDVWLCSGQSNMEMNYDWGLTRGKEDMETNQLPSVRTFIVPNATAATPQPDIGTQTWKPATSLQNIRKFSACGYFFGAALRQALPDVPIGLIDATWSGTPIQTWLSLDALHTVDDDYANRVENRRKQIDAWDRSCPFERQMSEWKATCNAKESDSQGKLPMEDGYDFSTWKSVELPVSMEEHIAPSFDGVVWYVRTVELDAAQLAEANAPVLNLGPIDDCDIAYVNGQKVGETRIYSANRRYKIPANLLRVGKNTIAIRVTDNGGAGGFQKDKAGKMVLSLTEKSSVPLAGTWACFSYIPPDMPENLDKPKSNSLAACYNAMVRPLFPLAIKGAIWYQGCSDVGRHEVYDDLFAALSADWRKGFSGGEFPIYLVQLAAFMQTHDNPISSAWAAMRWTLMQIGESQPHCGTAVAIDIGNHTDIHPKDKKTVGERLARLALARTYFDSSIVPCGPIPQSAVRSGDAIEIRFAYADGLKTSDGEKVKGFQISSDGKTYRWTDAEIKDSAIRIVSPDATEIRFAWDDYPVCNLVNGAGLPCGPFALPVRP